jgi:hypothetical protein
MNKEKDLPAGRQGQVFESGYSEKEMDLQVDKTKNLGQASNAKSINIFDSKKKKKPQEE